MITVSKPASFLKNSISILGSKYIANRVLPIAALAEGVSILKNVPQNKDIDLLCEGLKGLGVRLERKGDCIEIEGTGGNFKNISHLYTGDSGTFSRFIIPFIAFTGFSITVEGSKQMNGRPMMPLFEALQQLGVEIESTKENENGFGFLPARVQGPMRKKKCTLSGKQSSQYFSALLIIGAYLQEGLTILVTDELVSKPYVDMTIEVMKDFGIDVINNNYKEFIVNPNQRYKGREYSIETDTVSASYFFAMSALSNHPIKVKGFNVNSVQGEVEFLSVLRQMNFEILVEEDGVAVLPSKTSDIKSITVDMGNMPDVVQTLAIIAATLSDQETVITNISQLRYKESNRIDDTAKNLSELGIKIEVGEDYLKIIGGKITPTTVSCHDDHRMAMSFALLSIVTDEITLDNEECVKKSFPNYWDKLKELGFETKIS